MPLLKTFTLHTNYFDLGIFENVSFSLENSVDNSTLFAAGHTFGFFPIYTFFSRIFESENRVLFFIVLQSISLLVPVFYFYQRLGFLITFAYIAYAPVWSNALFDFHFDHLSIPLLTFFYFALLDKKIIMAVLSATLLMFVKEIYALQTIACGIMLAVASLCQFQIWNSSPSKKLAIKLNFGALFLAGIGVAHFLFTTHYLIPYFSYSGDQGFHGGTSFGWLGNSLSEMLNSILSKPHLILYEIISTPEKLTYLGIIFGLLVFIPLLFPIFLIPALPIILVALLSHTPSHYDYNVHYTAGLIIPLMFAFHYGTLRAKALYIKGTAVLKKYLFNISNINILKINFTTFIISYILIGNIFFSFSPISRFFWSQKIWSVSWNAYYPTERDKVIKQALELFIPRDESVAVTTQNTINWGPISRRHYYFPFPKGIFEQGESSQRLNRTFEGFLIYLNAGIKPQQSLSMRYAEYVVLDMKRPYYIIDEGCNWVYGKCKNKHVETHFLSLVSQTRTGYSTIFEYDGFEILQRRAK